MKKFGLVLLLIPTLLLAGCFGNKFTDTCAAQSSCLGDSYNIQTELKSEFAAAANDTGAHAFAIGCIDAAQAELAKYMALEISILSFERSGVSTLVKKIDGRYRVSYGNRAFEVEREKEHFKMTDMSSPYELYLSFSENTDALYMTVTTEGNLSVMMDYVKTEQGQYLQIAYKVDAQYRIIKLLATTQNDYLDYSFQYMFSAFAPSSLRGGIEDGFATGAGAVHKHI